MKKVVDITLRIQYDPELQGPPVEWNWFDLLDMEDREDVKIVKYDEIEEEEEE